ncbi:MAG: exodeoxyribonuclease III [Candidatus Izemoplasmatales bacterium]
MRLVTWNVNGLRAAMKKGFEDFFKDVNADIFAIQETKMHESQKDFGFPYYNEYWNNADKAGYSGTLIYTLEKPLNVVYGIDGELYNDEGRVITLEFEDFYFVNAYVPNSKRDLSRIPYRKVFEDDMRAYLSRLDQTKPVIYTGDLNVAHQEIDLKNPSTNHQNAGFTDDEREKMTALLASGFIDSFRIKYPDKIQYTWWSYMFNSRMNNAGWRIDYFILSKNLEDKIQDVIIRDDVTGSDHCPVVLEIDV